VVGWTAAAQGDSPVSDYQVLCTPSGDSGYAPVIYDAGTALIASVPIPDQTVNWSVQVRAENAAGWGPWSAAVVQYSI